MSLPMSILYWFTFALLGVGSVLAFLPARRPNFARAPIYMVVATAIIATLAIVVRWVAVGHPPIFGTFENTLAATWFMLVLALLALRTPNIAGVWRISMVWGLVLLAWGTRFRSEPVPLTISEKSLWVDVHAFFAWCAFAPLLVLGTLGAVRLIRRGREIADLSPTPLQVQTVISAAYVAFTAMLVTGAWYLNVLFGTFWQWGVVETVSLITWLLYGMVLHGILFRRWSVSWLMWALMLLIPILIITFFIWSVYPGTFHYFDVPLVRPY